MQQSRSGEPLISVVIPTHNRAHLLMRALQSVLQQTWRCLEAVLVDDGSTDGTQALLSTIHDERLRVLRLNVSRGAAAARNEGVRASKGEYIAFQDSDDLWLPDKLAAQMECMAETGADLVFCAFRRCREDGTVWQTFPHAEVQGGIITPKQLLYENLASTQTMLFRAELMKRLMFDERYPALEDWELALRAAAVGKVVYLPQPLVDVTERPDSLSKRQDRALAAQRLLFSEYGGDIRRDERLCRRWMAAFVHAGRGCGYRAWRECLMLCSLRHPPRLNCDLLVRAAKELLRPMK